MKLCNLLGPLLKYILHLKHDKQEVALLWKLC